MWVGIDPGKCGGIASIDEKGELCIQVMPDMHTVDCYFKDHASRIKHTFIEKCQPFGHEGRKSLFSFAEHYGILQGILIANAIPHTSVPVREWQKHMFMGIKPTLCGKKRNPKDRALEAANRVFAKKNVFWLASSRCRKPHDGMVDSSLIAEFCRRQTR